MISEFKETNTNTIEVDPNSHHKYKIELSVKRFNRFKLLNIFTKSFILHV